MCPRNRIDDGEAEAGASAGSALVPTAEAVEGPVEEGLAEARPAVGHAKLDVAANPAGFEPDGALAVAEGVLHEVSERLLEP